VSCRVTEEQPPELQAVSVTVFTPGELKRTTGPGELGPPWLAAAKGAGNNTSRVTQATEGSLERALYCRVAALVHAGEGRLDEALGLLARAARIYRGHGEPVERAECLVETGWLLVDEDPHAALPPLRTALGLLDAATSPWPALRLRQGLALCQVEFGRRRDAEALLEECRQLRERLAEPGDRLRAARTEAEIEARLGHEERAITMLRPVVEEWLARGEGFDAALAAVDLAELYIDRKAIRELADLGRLDERCRAAGLPPEPALALRTVLGLVAREGGAMSYRLTQLSFYLSQARHHPGLAYAPARREDEEVLWDELPPTERREICRRSGVEATVTGLPAAAVAADLRQLIAWSYQELTGIRIEWDAADGLEPAG
jgi:tetratricopeptide (TPR) repeat protein